MYSWYGLAEVCYAHLADFTLDLTLSDDMNDLDEYLYRFRICRWWTRGWTLQELIAPQRLRFYNTNWKLLARLEDVLETVSVITEIDIDVLLHVKPLSEVSIARRMSWVAHRRTTRPEDEAYCLLGIFDINMPMLYGEGRRAFVRLQEEIIKATTDLSIFAWEYFEIEAYTSHCSNNTLFAASPHAFSRCGRVSQVLSTSSAEPFELNNIGLRISSKNILSIGDGVLLLDLQCFIDYEPPRYMFLGLYKNGLNYHIRAAEGGRLRLLDAPAENGPTTTITIIRDVPLPRPTRFDTNKEMIRLKLVSGFTTLTLVDGLLREGWNLKAGLYRSKWPVSQSRIDAEPLICAALLRSRDATFPLVMFRKGRTQEFPSTQQGVDTSLYRAFFVRGKATLQEAYEEGCKYAKSSEPSSGLPTSINDMEQYSLSVSVVPPENGGIFTVWVAAPTKTVISMDDGQSTETESVPSLELQTNVKDGKKWFQGLSRSLLNGRTIFQNEHGHTLSQNRAGTAPKEVPVEATKYLREVLPFVRYVDDGVGSRTTAQSDAA